MKPKVVSLMLALLLTGWAIANGPASAHAAVIPDGTVMVEVGEGQAGDVATFFRARGFDNIALLKDFANIQRVIRVHTG